MNIDEEYKTGDILETGRETGRDIVENIILPDLNSKTYKLLFRNAGTNCGPVTRRSCGPISCKGSQLVYTIIALLNTLNNGNLADIRPDQLLDIYNYVTSRNQNISGFSLFNNPSKMGHIIIDSENTYNLFQDSSITIYPMALVNTTPFNNEFGNYPNGVISHYFIIIKQLEFETNETKYSIISSYGSDCVQIPQYETSLDINELLMVVEAFSSNESSEQRTNIIHGFLTKYFLQGGKTTYYIDEDSSSRKKIKKYRPDEGAEIEERIYYKLNKFKIYYFYDFVSKVHQQLLNYFENMIGGKKRKFTKRKFTKRKLTKRKFTKRKFTKRKKNT
jgi:hypothetical protein